MRFPLRVIGADGFRFPQGRSIARKEVGNNLLLSIKGIESKSKFDIPFPNFRQIGDKELFEWFKRIIIIGLLLCLYY